MPIPSFNKLPPSPSFNDLVVKVNQLVGEMTNMLLNLDSLNVVSLTADHIDAGTIDANVVTLRSDLNAGAYVQIDGNGMVINNGTFNTFTADINGQVTMTRALIQSSPSSYPRVVMDPDSTLFGAYKAANNSIYITANNISLDSPSLTWNNGVALADAAITSSGLFSLTATSDLRISTLDNLELVGGSIFLQNLVGSVYLQSWSDLVNSSTMQSLQSALNSKATSGASTSSDGSAFRDGGIPIGTLLAISGGGSVSWAGISIPSHSHTQI